MSKYASVIVGQKLKLPKTTIVYSIRDLNEDFHWFVGDVKIESFIVDCFQTDVVDLFNTLREEHDHFQVRFQKNIKSLVEKLTEGNYIWLDTREVYSGDGVIFFHQRHEKSMKNSFKHN